MPNYTPTRSDLLSVKEEQEMLKVSEAALIEQVGDWMSKEFPDAETANLGVFLCYNHDLRLQRLFLS